MKEEYLSMETVEKLAKCDDLQKRENLALDKLNKQITFCKNDSQCCYEICNQTIIFLKKIKNILERSDRYE